MTTLYTEAMSEATALARQVAPMRGRRLFQGGLPPLLCVLSATMSLPSTVPGACSSSSLVLGLCSLGWFACLQSAGTVLPPLQTSEHMAGLAWEQAQPSPPAGIFDTSINNSENS